MKKPKSSRPSFFKVLIHYTTKLMLPPHFVRTFGKFIPKTAKLRTISGQTWEVNLKEEICDDDGNKYLCFVGGGWAKFVKDSKLKLGEFVVFFLNVRESTFDVSVYGTNLCERPRISPIDVDSHAHAHAHAADSTETKSENDSHNVPETASASGKILKPLYYEVTLKNHHQSRVTLKNKFSKAAGLARKEMVRVVGKHCSEWIELDHKKRGKRIDLAKGWSVFRLGNALDFGKTYSFEFKPTKNVIHVKQVNIKN